MMQYFSPEANTGVRKKAKANPKDAAELNTIMNKRYNTKKKIPTPTPAQKAQHATL